MRTLFHFSKDRPEWINESIGDLRAFLKKNQSSVIIVTLLIGAILSSIMSINKYINVTNLISSQSKRDDKMLRELNELSSLLHDMESNTLNTEKQQIALQSLEKNISSANKSMIDIAKGTDIQNISHQIAIVKDDLNDQISDLKKTVSTNIGGKEYLEVNALPFHVISIDIISGQPYVSVDYENHISPLSVGDSLAGWKIESVDYDSYIVQFINEHNQYIKVRLQGE